MGGKYTCVTTYDDGHTETFSTNRYWLARLYMWLLKDTALHQGATVTTTDYPR